MDGSKAVGPGTDSAPVVSMKHEGYDGTAAWKGSKKTGACFFDGISDIYFLDSWFDTTAASQDFRDRNFCERYGEATGCSSIPLSDRDKDTISSASHGDFLARPSDFDIQNWKIIECGSSLGSTAVLSKCGVFRDVIPQTPQQSLCNLIKSDKRHTCDFASFPDTGHSSCLDTNTNGACYRWFDNLIK